MFGGCWVGAVWYVTPVGLSPTHVAASFTKSEAQGPKKRTFGPFASTLGKKVVSGVNLLIFLIKKRGATPYVT